MAPSNLPGGPQVSFFNLFKKGAADVLVKVTGKKEVLEAGMGIAALAANADGKVDEAEIVGAIEGVKQIDALKAAFTEAEIEAAAVKQFDRLKSIMGRNKIRTELEDIKNFSDEDRENAFLIGAMAAEAVGGVGSEERTSLLNSAKVIGVSNAAQLLAA